jgi:hypothetical protein
MPYSDCLAVTINRYVIHALLVTVLLLSWWIECGHGDPRLVERAIAGIPVYSPEMGKHFTMEPRIHHNPVNAATIRSLQWRSTYWLIVRTFSLVLPIAPLPNRPVLVLAVLPSAVSSLRVIYPCPWPTYHSWHVNLSLTIGAALLQKASIHTLSGLCLWSVPLVRHSRDLFQVIPVLSLQKFWVYS